MTRLDVADPRVRELVERLGAFARETLERAAERAWLQHAQEVAPEHLLTAVLLDETAGATRLVLFAFADPETIADEVRALSPGVMVVGSSRTLPFSPGGVETLEGARERALRRAAAVVAPIDLLGAAWERFDGDQRALAPPPPAVAGEGGGGPGGGPPRGPGAPGASGEPLLRAFADETRRALAAACRVADRWGREAIGPVHVAAGVLDVDEELRAETGLTAGRLRVALGDRDADERRLAPRSIAPDADLVRLLSELEPGADTLAILGWFLGRGDDEVRMLLHRQKVTLALYEHAREGFEDP